MDTERDVLAGPSGHPMLTLKAGAHLCLVYDDPYEQIDAIAPFFQQGLQNRERCVYVADDLSLDDLARGLATHGINVDSDRRRGALLLWTREEWRQPGELRSARKAVQVLRIVEDAINSGYQGIRFAIEMTWTLGPDIDVHRLRHWEATLDQLVARDLPVRISCQYSRDRLPSRAVDAGLATHRHAVINSHVRPNPCYAVESVLNGSFDDRATNARKLDSMLAALGRAARDDAEVRSAAS